MLQGEAGNPRLAIDGSCYSAAALRCLFTRLDTNCDGKVDWNEFSDHLLLGGDITGATQAPAASHTSQPCHYSPAQPVAAATLASRCKTQHTAPMAALLCAAADGAAMVDGAAGCCNNRWLSVGRDGCIRTWGGEVCCCLPARLPACTYSCAVSP